MAVSRRIEVAFDAPDDETADWFADYLRRVVMNEQGGYVSFEDVRRLREFPITGQAFSSEPVIIMTADAVIQSYPGGPQ